ncbi:MAG TPA: hypothetical protein EYM84_06930 [Flavobacteriales bacterium]|nr:hypothetical protein [Flavobacteriales bacterium]
MDIKNAFITLRSNMLFQVSLGSKELFHSNFLAWLFDSYKSLAHELFLPFMDGSFEFLSEGSFVDREKGNTDLRLNYVNNRHVVIENKVKSMPYKEQLEKYAKNTGKDHCYILLSLIKPEFIDASQSYQGENGTWQYLSYGELASRLQSLSGKYKTTIEKKDLHYLEDYIEFIAALDAFAKCLKINFKEDPFDFYGGTIYLEESYNEPYLRTQDLRMHDLFLKTKYLQIRDYLETKCKEIFPNAFNTNMQAHTGFSNGSANLTVFYQVAKGIQVGMQLQSNHFRMYAQVSGNSKKALAFTTQLNEQNLWFDFTGGATHHNPASIKGKGRIIPGFNSYSGVFIYKYVKLEGYTVAQLMDEFTGNLQLILKRLPKIEKVVYAL